MHLSDLIKRMLHTDCRIGESKAVSIGKILGESNSSIEYLTCSDHLEAHNVEEIVDQPEVVDCLDNLDTSYLPNACCVNCGIPFVRATVLKLSGQAASPQSPRLPVREAFSGATPDGVLSCSWRDTELTGGIPALEALTYLTGISAESWAGG